MIGPPLAPYSSVVNRVHISVLFVFITAIAVVRPPSAEASTINTEDQICDVAADAALGAEDYSRAIAQHQRILAHTPKDALAHYHLGFAYGMAGRRDRELEEYRRAAELGLRQWDLYLNLGRAYLESTNYPAAVDALANAEALAPQQSETHFNMGLAYERLQRFDLAEQEMKTAMRLGADPASTGNMLAVVYAESGKQAAARAIWAELARHESIGKVAQANLALLDHLILTTAK